MSDVSQPADGPGRAERQAALAALTGKQMFFIGASPRTGTTWLQLLLDAHPDISCRGEGHFFDSLKPECAALGEKTPDNVHWFAKLRQIFPRARFIHLVRDPRDVLVFGWNHNARLNPGWSETHDVQSFVCESLSLVERDIRTGEAFGQRWPESYLCLS